MTQTNEQLSELHRSLIRDRDDTVAELRRLGENIVSEIKQMNERLDAGQHVNACGILQTRGSDLDKAAALYEKLNHYIVVAEFDVRGQQS